jgi:hypothetical protein
MLVLDENVSENEIWRLRKAGIALRVIGVDIAPKSISDENIVPLLLTLKKPTFFTRDRDFWNADLCHPKYALVFLDVPEIEGEVARHIRLFLRDPRFKTAASRLGKVFQIQPSAIRYWLKDELRTAPWNKT